MLRRIAAAALAAGAAGLCLPAMAAQAAAGITVVSASSPARSVGALAVTLESTTPVVRSSITAELFAPEATKPALTVASFELTSGANTAGSTTTWTVASPITTKQLALGRYRIEVKAANTGGNTANVADAGTLAFVIKPTISVYLSGGATYSYGQSLTISGTDVGRYPGGTTAGVDGQQITVVPGVTTTSYDHDSTPGYFAVTLQAGVSAGQAVAGGVQAEALPDSTTARAYSDQVAVTIDKDQVQLSATVTPALAAYGSVVTISGTARYQVAGTTSTMFLAKAQVQATENGCTASAGCTYSATTASSGGYSISGVPAGLPEQYSVTVAVPPAWFTETPVTATVQTDDVPVSLNLQAQAQVSGGVQLTACAALPRPATPAYDLVPFSPVAVRYSASPSGPWTALSSGGVSSGGCFTFVAPDQPGDRYYQAALAANSQDAAATSSAILATLPAESAIVHYKIRPRKLRKAGDVRVTGTLEFGHGTLTAAGPHQKIQILFLADGSKRWHVLRTTRTGRTGEFSVLLPLGESGQLAARYNGNAVTFACRTGWLIVRIVLRSHR